MQATSIQRHALLFLALLVPSGVNAACSDPMDPEQVVAQDEDPKSDPESKDPEESQDPVESPDPDDEEHAPVRKPLPSAEEIAKLPADGGDEFNRLVFEASPYLRQHARNPVDWWAWGDDAFARAKELDKPVFLSIGYATCHWCHVMEHESFEDPEVAKLMNESFICVKVDREERPDLDHIYMQVTQAITKRGGWPMTVVMTGDAEPFFAGTYFPKEDRGGRPGMLSLIPSLTEAWTTNREAVVADASRITDWLRENSGGSPGADLDARVVETGVHQLAARFDARNKGFGQKPKFPLPHNLSLMLRWSVRTGDAQILKMVEDTLVAMRAGGIFDQIGGGYHRYATDAAWFLPHFEKMLYDQALHVMAYTGTYQVTGNEAYKQTAQEILTYVLRDMQDPAGGFYCAEDADSEGEEGVFYTWPLQEVLDVLGEDDGQLVVDAYAISTEGNYVDEGSNVRVGRSILMPVVTTDQLAAARGVEAPEIEARLAAARAKLFAHREHRIRPFLDDKVLTDWNGLMIAALARAGFAFDDARALEAARASADFVLRELRTPEGRLMKRWRDGNAGAPATLEDHAFLAWGLLELYQADFDLRWLREAQATVDTMIAHFHDAENGGFFITADDGAQLLVRAKEIYDGAIPSGSSVASLALVQLARLTGEPKYEEIAAGTFRCFAGQVNAGPGSYAQLLQAVEMVAGGGVEVVIAGAPDDPRTQALLAELRKHYLGNGVVVLNDPTQVDALKKLIPYAESMTTLDGVPAAYVCREFVCEAPVTDPAEFGRALAAAVRVSE